MRRSQLFIKTRKEVPTDETSLNAQLLIRAGYVHKEMAGVYSYLPLGKKVLENIIQIIREEMNNIGGQELLLSSLQDKSLWETSERWDDEIVDVWFKTTLQAGGDLGLAWSHEEPMTRMMSHFISSYKDLPVYTYQFQSKLRNELRAKSGLLRAREFVMKDLYSFSRDQAEHDEFYAKITDAYMRVYERLGLGEITYKTFASGGAFSKFSHEFQTLSHVGEDTIYLSKDKKIAINQEVLNDEVLGDLGVSREELTEEKAVEVGNIFTLGTRFSEPLNLYFADHDGTSKPVIMGSYGIGPSRLVGLLAEHFADEQGLVWPEVVAPFKVYLARLGNDEVVVKAADELYEQLTGAGVSVLYDDRDERAGEMFKDADLLGLPYRVVVSQRSLDSNNFEIKSRSSTESKQVNNQELLDSLANS
jgi:prolyl-tRNA synthetase